MTETHEQRAREIVKYDPVCRCGIALSNHSAYENHSFTEMDTQDTELVNAIAAALAEVERETAKKCAEMVDCESTRNRIRRKFGLEEEAKRG